MFFAYTKSLQKSNFLPPLMKHKEKTSDTLQDTTNLFAQYFSSAHSDTPNNTVIQCQNNCNYYFPISTDDIESVIKVLIVIKLAAQMGFPLLKYNFYHLNTASFTIQTITVVHEIS